MTGTYASKVGHGLEATARPGQLQCPPPFFPLAVNGANVHLYRSVVGLTLLPSEQRGE